MANMTSVNVYRWKTNVQVSRKCLHTWHQVYQQNLRKTHCSSINSQSRKNKRYVEICDEIFQIFPIHPLEAQESILYRKTKHFSEEGWYYSSRFAKSTGGRKELPSVLLHVTTLKSIRIRLITHEIKDIDVKLIRNPIHIPT